VCDDVVCVCARSAHDDGHTAHEERSCEQNWHYWSNDFYGGIVVMFELNLEIFAHEQNYRERVER
jgi:hypothetical protein